LKPLSSTSSEDGGYLKCSQGYVIPDSSEESSSAVTCKDGLWVVEINEGLLSEGSCSPFCSTFCKNGGKCVSPDTCECTERFTGPGCAHEICTDDFANPGFGYFDGG